MFLLRGQAQGTLAAHGRLRLHALWSFPTLVPQVR
jgi:hypothetical protein